MHGVRLSKYLVDCAIASRRQARRLIREGRVKVNGVVVKDPDRRVVPGRDVVEYEGQAIKPIGHLYIAFYKPQGYLTAFGKAPDGKEGIDRFLEGLPKKVGPAGRLDYDAEGLLLLTDDGELAHRVMHPKYKLPKTYEVLVEGRVEAQTLEKMLEGAHLRDGLAKPESLKLLGYWGEDTLLEVVFTEGRYHLVKRFMAYFGHKVKRLKRTAIGPIRLGDLKPGQWRHLSKEEIEALRLALGMDNIQD